MSFDVTVIGAGASGATVAMELATRGAKVRLLDSGPDLGAGCSWANAGLLSPSHVEPLTTPKNIALGMQNLFSASGVFSILPTPTLAPWIARFLAASTPQRAEHGTAVLQGMARQSVELHKQYVADGVATGLQESGSLDLYSADNPPAGESVRVGDLEPSLAWDGPGVVHSEDVFLDSRIYLRGVLDRCAELGVEIRWNTDVRGFLRDGGGTVRALDVGDDLLTSDTFVIAAGNGATALGRSAGVTLPVVGARGYVVDVATEGPVPSRPVTIKPAKVVLTPYADRLRICGTLELGFANPRPSRFALVRDAGMAVLPDTRITDVREQWTGLRPCLPDGVPAIGVSERQPNIAVAAGPGMWGMVLAPITGRLLAQQLNGEDAEIPELLHPDRFSGDPVPEKLRRKLPSRQH